MAPPVRDHQAAAWQAPADRIEQRTDVHRYLTRAAEVVDQMHQLAASVDRDPTAVNSVLHGVG
jgi:hypothetical protein